MQGRCAPRGLERKRCMFEVKITSDNTNERRKRRREEEKEEEGEKEEGCLLIKGSAGR